MFAKKTVVWVLAGVGAVVVSSLGIATSWSYIKTLWRGVGQTIREVTPIAFDLERLNTELKDLEPEIRRNQAVVAQLEVELENLEAEIAQMEKEQEKLFAEMRTLREALEENRSEYQFASGTYTRSQVESDLARRLDQYQARQAALDGKKQLLVERRKNYEAAVRRVQQYRQQYDQLRIKAESLAAQLKTLEAAQAAGSVSIDQSRLARAKELAKEIETRIRVAQRMMEAEWSTPGEIRLEEETARPVTERFDELFRTRTEQAQRDDTGI